MTKRTDLRLLFLELHSLRQDMNVRLDQVHERLDKQDAKIDRLQLSFEVVKDDHVEIRNAIMRIRIVIANYERGIRRRNEIVFKNSKI